LTNVLLTTQSRGDPTSPSAPYETRAEFSDRGPWTITLPAISDRPPFGRSIE